MPIGTYGGSLASRIDPNAGRPISGWAGSGQPVYGNTPDQQAAADAEAERKHKAAMDALALENAKGVNWAQDQSARLSQRLAGADYMNPGSVGVETTGASHLLTRGGGGGGGGPAGGGPGGGMTPAEIEAMLAKMKPTPEPIVQPPPIPGVQPLPREGPGGSGLPAGQFGGAQFAPGQGGMGMDIPAGPSPAFSRAKDVAGRQGTAAISALKDVMSRRGMGNSSMEGREGANILGSIAQHLTDVEFQDTTNREDRAFEAAKAMYEGNITQRGQDVNYLGTGRGQDVDYASNKYAGAVDQRGQNINQQSNWMNLIPQVYALAQRRY